MAIHGLAGHFTEPCASGRSDEAAKTYRADDIATCEAMPGERSETHGKAETVFYTVQDGRIFEERDFC